MEAISRLQSQLTVEYGISRGRGSPIAASGKLDKNTGYLVIFTSD
jgi:hypothetical protein